MLRRAILNRIHHSIVASCIMPTLLILDACISKHRYMYNVHKRCKTEVIVFGSAPYLQFHLFFIKLNPVPFHISQILRKMHVFLLGLFVALLHFVQFPCDCRELSVQ